jgi:Alternative complex III, ActD subunit
MPEETVHLALFSDIDPASQALDALREMGIQDKDMTIISGVPYSDRMLGRPMSWTRVPQLAISGFVLGFIVSLLLNFGTPLLYPIYVGGLPLLPIPTTAILTFEISMLGLLAFTFLGVVWESAFPTLKTKEYHPEISDGKIAVVFNCPEEIHTRAHEALTAMGAEWIHRTEAVTP